MQPQHRHAKKKPATKASASFQWGNYHNAIIEYSLNRSDKLNGHFHEVFNEQCKMRPKRTCFVTCYRTHHRRRRRRHHDFDGLHAFLC